MMSNKIVLGLCRAAVLTIALSLAGCSRQQSDWQKTRETNTADAYEQFLKKYPSGEFTAQAQARVKELYEERDWQKARDADTPEAYQAFLKQYPEGKWTEEARIRVENFTLAQAPSANSPSGPTAPPSNPAPNGADVGGTPPSTEPGPAVAATPPPNPKTKAPKAKSGTYGVQLGAFKSGPAAAGEHWTRLQKDYPDLFAGLASKVVPKKTAEGHLYRLQAVGLSEKHARDVCKALKSKSQPCVVVPPSHG
ncbi:MAG: hypothetical protein JWN43_2658 [Gammaproteobacteria bacterium]|nr:hypothetical protein [Gammaproteobacteria bacterium]